MSELKEQVSRRIEKTIKSDQNYSKYKDVIIKNINDSKYIKILVIKFKDILEDL